MARFSCADCQKRAYDMDTGKPQTYEAGPNAEKRFIELGHVAPCKTGWECPKISPEHEHEFILSDRNHRVVRLYHQVRIAGPQAIGEIDPLLAELLAAVDRVYNGWEREEDRRKSDQLLIALQKPVRIVT